MEYIFFKGLLVFSFFGCLIFCAVWSNNKFKEYWPDEEDEEDFDSCGAGRRRGK